MKLKTSTDFSEITEFKHFQRRASYRLVYLHEKLSIFIKSEQISVQIMIFLTKAFMNEADFSVDSAYLLIFWQINTKLERY